MSCSLIEAAHIGWVMGPAACGSPPKSVTAGGGYAHRTLLVSAPHVGLLTNEMQWCEHHVCWQNKRLPPMVNDYAITCIVQ